MQYSLIPKAELYIITHYIKKKRPQELFATHEIIEVEWLNRAR